MRALLRLVDELEEQRDQPGRWYAGAAGVGRGREPGRRAYAEEVARALRRLPRRPRAPRPPRRAAARPSPRSTRARGARRAGARRPSSSTASTTSRALQRDAVETLAATGAPVTLSLAYEPGRVAFAGRATTFEELGARRRARRAEGRAPSTTRRSRAPASPRARPVRAARVRTSDDPGDALILLEGGGERAELELVAAEVARLVREEGFAPEEIAVVLRDPARGRGAARAGVRRARGAGRGRARIAFGHTALGRGLVALLRCALLRRRAADLLAWLRTPGCSRGPSSRTRSRSRRARAAATARRRATCGRPSTGPAAAIERVRAADRAAAPSGRLRGRGARALFTAPHAARREVLTGAAAQDAEWPARGGRALDELERWRRGIPRWRRRRAELARAARGPRGARRRAAGPRAGTR